MGDDREIRIGLFGESINLLDPELGENFIAERGEELFSYIKKIVTDAIKNVKGAECAPMADGFREGIAELEEELKATDIAADIRNFLERVAAYFRSVVSRLTGGETEADSPKEKIADRPKTKIKEKNMDSKEYEMVKKLFDSGKITEEERDKLLAALGSESDVDEEVDEAQEVIDATDELDDFEDDDYDDITDAKALAGALGKLGSKINNVIKESKINEKIGEVFNEVNLDEKINEVVRKSMETANAALRQAGESINKALDGLRDRGEASSSDDDTVIKTSREDYDVPYDELEISIKYRKGAKSFDYIDRGKNVERIKAQLRESLDGDSLSTVEKLLDEKFTGYYKKTSGDLVIIFGTTKKIRDTSEK